MLNVTGPSGYEFSADPARIDAAWVHRTLVDHAYWAQGRTRSANDAALAASRTYGVYQTGGAQVAFARVVTDGVTFAWLADVVVAPEHQGRGLGTLLVAGVRADLEPLGLRRVVLKASAEGHSLYQRAGWTALEEPDAWMTWVPGAPGAARRPR